MSREYWAYLGRKKCGPHVTRKEALADFRERFPNAKTAVLTSHSNGCDIRFHGPRDDIETVKD